MFAVVEFAKGKCAVIPLNWMSDDQSQTYWPVGYSSQKDLVVKIIKSEEPRKWWWKYDILKTHKLFDSEAQSIDGEVITVVVNLLDEEVGEVMETGNISEPSKRKPSQQSSQISNESSDTDFSDIEVAANSSFNIPTPAHNVNMSVTRSPNQSGTLLVQNPTLGDADGEGINLLKTILRRVNHISAVQDQHSIILNNILQLNQTTMTHALIRPEDLPALPVSTKSDYKAFEELLRNPEKFDYMRSRLACVGGANVRNAVMNMLKFVITDQVAMKFNWIHRDNRKRAFKSTMMCRVVQEAVMVAYGNQNREDMSDKEVKSAIKDWLKLAKYRYENQTKRRRTN